ncbi:MFS transporter [Persicimonas caeni]|nr:MFS transporter [Persicimonas caeni]
MTDDHATQGAITRMERNIRLYPWYAAFFNAFFWMPVFFLYFGAHLPLSRVLQLEGVYYAAVVLLEVPSGYFSDRVGRRTTLLTSSVLLIAAYLLFFFGAGFAAFALAQVLLAAGIAFNSGTDTSFHYDSLATLGRAVEYEEREAIVARNSLVATGAAALLGGAVASVDLSYAYGASALTAVVALGLVFSFAEPEHREAEASDFVHQIAHCLAHLKQPQLAWLFGFAVLAVVINHVPYEFYQPYLDVLGTQVGLGEHTALAAGAHMAVATLIGAWFARRSARIDKRLGTGRTLLLAAVIQLAIIGSMALVLHAAVVVLILLRGVPSGLYKAPLNAAVTPRIPQEERATYLSIQSLAGRLGFTGLLAGLSLVAGDAGVDHWPVLSELLVVAVVVGGAGWLVLAGLLPLVELNGKRTQN